MPLDNWEHVQALFNKAADLSPDERVEFLGTYCADVGLREEVESLLAADLHCGSRIASAVEDEAAQLFDEPTLADDRLGAYRIVREIGRGGMGVVYLAVRDDDQYRKQVAIKVVKRGMDTQACTHACRFLEGQYSNAAQRSSR